MAATLTDPRRIPRLPVLGWRTFSGPREAQLPCLLDAPRVLLTTSGRASIALALELLGVSSGDRVLMPTYHCPTMVAALKHRGGIPVFYGLDRCGRPDIGHISRDTLDSVKAILVAHYFGRPQPMAMIRAMCDEHRIPLIEDCAHALFGESDGRPIGQWGDLAIGSLTKFMPVSEGGILVSARHDLRQLRLSSRGSLRDAIALADAIELGAQHERFPGLNAPINSLFALKRALRNRGKLQRNREPEDIDAPSDTWDGFEIDTNLAHKYLTAPTRWIVNRSHRQRIVERRVANYRFLAKAFAGHSGFSPLFPDFPARAAPYVFPLHVQAPREKYRQLKRLGVPVFRWDRLWPGTPQIESDTGLAWSSEVFQFPCHQDLTAEELQLVADKVLAICR